MTITDETIDYVGILAKLELSDEEKEQAKQDMSNMLEYVSKLNELDTDSVEPAHRAFPGEDLPHFRMKLHHNTRAL